jgi:hypothetical protein
MLETSRTALYYGFERETGRAFGIRRGWCTYLANKHKQADDSPPKIRMAGLFAKFSNDHDQQLRCPLFSHLPAELRNRIFTLALLRYDDESQKPYPFHTYYTRPGYMYPKRIDTSLLATCRRIYLETRLVPLNINEHVFWCFCGPRMAHSDPWLYFSRMTHDQRCSVVRVHFFTRMYWLEGTFPIVCDLQTMAIPKHLKITIRHSDWWDWEKNEQLGMKMDWTRNLYKLEGLEELEVELECLDRDRDQVCWLYVYLYFTSSDAWRRLASWMQSPKR